MAHTPQCLAAATICAVENRRDAILYTPGHAVTAESFVGTVEDEGLRYLEDGTKTCECPRAVHHLHECWQHNDIASLAQMIAATRELLAGTAVCDDPEHDASALPEWLDIAEQNQAISSKG